MKNANKDPPYTRIIKFVTRIRCSSCPEKLLDKCMHAAQKSAVRNLFCCDFTLVKTSILKQASKAPSRCSFLRKTLVFERFGLSERATLLFAPRQDILHVVFLYIATIPSCYMLTAPINYIKTRHVKYPAEERIIMLPFPIDENKSFPS